MGRWRVTDSKSKIARDGIEKRNQDRADGKRLYRDEIEFYAYSSAKEIMMNRQRRAWRSGSDNDA